MDDGGSRLIFGCMGLGGGWGTGPLEAAHVQAAHEAMDAALEAGIRDFDHADIYAHGKAEAVFGRVLAERPGLREDIRLQTKCGIRLPAPEKVGQYDSSREWIRAQVDASLLRLGVEQLDTLLIHRPDPLARPEEIAEAFTQLKEAGKVLRLGVSNMSAEQMRWLQTALPEPLAANQLEMSLHRSGWLESGVLVNHDEAADIGFPHGTVEYCQVNGIELQAWGALAQGRYSGAAGTAETGPDAAAAALVAALAEEKSTAPEAVVLGWLLRHPARIRPVLGTSNPGRIRACAGAGRVAEAMSRHEWYSLWVAARGRALP
ncbi:aldo/keto reductase [Arthrobacter crystallopoietes BAB-32]|uniref:Aldo/keto reductase n=1 Tax=Arthrobacter crystallopoietes BAB-32 TaxID=1246476 RepID=N1USF8_9MICC|nr:aldo/keto reductase [Arthrobacter crystallopoietes]EMY33326.1 aldo/keto reductase [Arthrobacter crystallopoietes BAB-32]